MHELVGMGDPARQVSVDVSDPPRQPVLLAEPGRQGSRLRPAVKVTAAGLGAVVVALVLLVGTGWVVTPSVARAEGRVIAELHPVGGRDLGRLPSPDRVGQAVIAVENSRFDHDIGVDPLGVAARLMDQGGLGGATIEQQLAKVLYTGGSDSMWAKAEQVELALKLDEHYSKAQILEMYLNAVYYGNGFYGLEAASQGYFGLAAQQLSWGQASLLAGLIQAPSAYDPLVHLSTAQARQAHVLDRLVATGVLTRDQAAAALAAPLNLR